MALLASLFFMQTKSIQDTKKIFRKINELKNKVETKVIAFKNTSKITKMLGLGDWID